MAVLVCGRFDLLPLWIVPDIFIFKKKNRKKNSSYHLHRGPKFQDCTLLLDVRHLMVVTRRIIYARN